MRALRPPGRLLPRPGAAAERHRPRLGRGGLDDGLGSLRWNRWRKDRDAHVWHLGAAERRSNQVRLHPRPGGRSRKGAALMKPTAKLHEAGQSLWLDNITRTMLADGTLEGYIKDLSVTGLTSNPTIFDKAISGGEAYDRQIAELSAGSVPEQGIG